jgi:hypothetical protein
MAVSTFKPGAGAAGGNDTGGTVVVSASHTDSAAAFTLAGDFTATEHVIQVQAEPNAAVTVLLLDSTNAVLTSKTVTADAGGAGAVTMTFPSGVAKLAVSGVVGYITVLKFETEKTLASIGPTGYEHFSQGQSDPLQFMKIGYSANVIQKGNLYVKENAHSWFIPNGGNSVSQYWIISKKTGAADFPIVIRTSTDYQLFVNGDHGGFAVTDDYIMMGQNEVNVPGANFTDVFKFVYNEATDQYVCDLDESSQYLSLALPAGHASNNTLQSFEYAPNIGANGTLFTNSYGDTSVYYSQDHGATWGTMGGSVSSNGANLRYYRDTVNGDDHLLYNGFPYTADLKYCNDFTDLANATWTSWSWPSSSTDYLNIDYNEQGQFWTTTFESDQNSAFVATSLGGSWTNRSFTSLHGRPSPAKSVNGTTVIFSRSNTNSTTNSMIAWSTDGVTWNTVDTSGGPTNRTFFNGTSFTNAVNPILFASGTKIRGIGDYGGFQFETATNQAMLPFSPLLYHYGTKIATDPTGQYVGAIPTNDAAMFSADYGNTWTYVYGNGNSRWVHWWNNKFWVGEYNTSNDFFVEYNPATSTWTQTYRNFTYTYANGMTALSDDVAFTFDYTTTGLTMYTNDGGATWSNGNDALNPVASNDSKIAYGVYSSNIASFTSTAQLDAYVVDVNGSTVNRSGGSNGDFYVHGIPYKNGAVLVGKDTGNQNNINFLYIVDGVAQHGISNGWVQLSMSNLTGQNITSWDTDDKPQLWAFAGKLFCQITQYGYLTGVTNVTLQSADDGKTWSVVNIDTPLRNANLFPKHQSSLAADNGDWHNNLGNADYNVYDRGYFYITAHAGSSGQVVTGENNISLMRITSGVEEI